MYLFGFLHSIAARRGDGLRPELSRLLNTRAAILTAVVVELRPGADGFEQAGPNPVGNVQDEPPDGVIRFPARRKPRARHRSRHSL